jgi:hypothetical protein
MDNTILGIPAKWQLRVNGSNRGCHPKQFLPPIDGPKGPGKKILIR